MARQRVQEAHMNDSNYEWGYSRQLYQRKFEQGSVYISNQLGNGFNYITMNYAHDQHYEVNNIKWKFFLEGETIFVAMSAWRHYQGGEITILWEEIDNT